MGAKERRFEIIGLEQWIHCCNDRSRAEGYLDIIRATQLIHCSPGMLFITTCLARPSPSFLVMPPDIQTTFLQLARSTLIISNPVELMTSARLSCHVSRVRPLPWMPC